jgi:lipoate-protein ligase B
MRQLEIIDLGTIDFRRAWYFQREVFKGVRAGIIPSTLVLCRHNPVITLGSQGRREHIKAGLAELDLRGIEIYEIERGGDVTYHGPGQIVVYPIFNLRHLKKDIHWFIRKLEDVMLDFLADFGIEGARKPSLSGVWVDGRKIGSIGIAIKDWITFHGLSLNIKKSVLSNFKLIKPCGLDIEVTSLESVLGRIISINHAKKILLEQFRQTFLPRSNLVCNEKMEFCITPKSIG